MARRHRQGKDTDKVSSAAEVAIRLTVETTSAFRLLRLQRNTRDDVVSQTGCSLVVVCQTGCPSRKCEAGALLFG